MEATIEVAGLRNRFRPARRVTGFAGPNGAGKSTTMRVIAGTSVAHLIAAAHADNFKPFIRTRGGRSHRERHRRATLEEAYMELTRDAVS
jgi:ATPase subunit of ABC transporter with duplicated ATPase domains